MYAVEEENGRPETGWLGDDERRCVEGEDKWKGKGEDVGDEVGVSSEGLALLGLAGSRSEDKDCIVEALKKRPLQAERDEVEEEEEERGVTLQEEADLHEGTVGKVGKEDEREKGKRDPRFLVHLMTTRVCVPTRIMARFLFLVR